MMKSPGMLFLFLSCVVSTLMPKAASSQTATDRDLSTPIESPVLFNQRNLSGPRFGMTYLAGNGRLRQEARDHDMGRMLSQFGWHFEYQIVPEGGGPQFVVETVPLVAGVEYGKLVPNLTLAMGVRFPNGFEFGLGPHLLFVGGDEEPVITSLVVAVGKSFDYGGVSLPVNLALSTSPDGNQISLMFGYAISRKRGAKTQGW